MASRKHDDQTLFANQGLQDRVAVLRQRLIDRLAPDLIGNPQLADALNRHLGAIIQTVVDAGAQVPPPPDMGLAELVGIGDEAAAELRETRLPSGVQPYDETVTSERILAVADLYYIYQHETIGVFRAVQKLQELFRAGAVKLSSGRGAFGLYRFDRREVLRYTRRDRLAAYCRVLGYNCDVAMPPGARPNTAFHPLFSNFNNQVAQFWRDKRVSDVIRERAYDPSFGSIAVVRRSGLDLRNTLKFSSYGHLNVLRVEVMQLLDEAFRVLDSDDIKRLFAAEGPWDVVEEVLVRYFNVRPVTSPRQRMAVAGREVLRWLAHPHILESNRAEFEAHLLEIAEFSEEWLTSAQALGLARRRPSERSSGWEHRAPTPRPARAVDAAVRAEDRARAAV